MDRASVNLQVTVIGISVALVVGGLLWFGLGSTQPSPVVAIVNDAPAPTTISVHVSGEVTRAGLVSVPAGSRVADALSAAGGATRSADLSAVNLAAPVRDGERVVVPRTGEAPDSGGADSGVDLNMATASELEALPGVGPVLASRIVAHRDDHGFFEAVEDLLDVPGIGEAKLDGMRESIASP